MNAVKGRYGKRVARARSTCSTSAAKSSISGHVTLAAGDRTDHGFSKGGAFVEFDDRGCRQLLKKHPALASAIRRAIGDQIANGLFKCKFATSIRLDGRAIYECRVNERSIGAVRVAFTMAGDTVKVIFISKDIQKRTFTANLESFLRKKSS